MLCVSKRQFLILILFLLSAIPFVHAQDILKKPVSIHANSRNLRQVLQELHDSTKVLFVFHDALVNEKNVTDSFKNIPLDKALTRILKPARLNWEAIDENLITLYPTDVTDYDHNIQPKKPEYKLPTKKTNISPSYPRLAQHKGLEGTVVMHILVGTEGNVEDVKVAESSGYPILDDAAVNFAENLKYNPARQGSLPVPVWTQQKVSFSLTNREVFQMEPFNTIESLRSELVLDPNSVEKHTRLLDAYLYGIRYLMSQNNLYFNTLLKQFLEYDLFYAWEEFKDDVPLYFLLMHDYLTLYPNSPMDNEAEKFLGEFIEYVEDHIHIIQPVRSLSREKMQRFKRTVAVFIETSYPALVHHSKMMNTP